MTMHVNSKFFFLIFLRQYVLMTFPNPYFFIYLSHFLPFSGDLNSKSPILTIFFEFSLFLFLILLLRINEL